MVDRWKVCDDGGRQLLVVTYGWRDDREKERDSVKEEDDREEKGERRERRGKEGKG